MEIDDRPTPRRRKRKRLFSDSSLSDASPITRSVHGETRKQSKSEKSVADRGDAAQTKRLQMTKATASPLVAATQCSQTTADDPPYSEVMAAAHALQDEVDAHCSGVEDRDTAQSWQRWCASQTKRLQQMDVIAKKKISESHKRKDVSKSLSREFKKIEDLQKQLRQLKDEDDSVSPKTAVERSISPKTVARRQEHNRKAASTRFLDAIDKLRGKGDT